MIRIFIFLLCFLRHASAEQIEIGISFSIPPYVIEEQDAGIELDILREAFSVRGHTVIPRYLPLARTFSQYDANIIDGVINVIPGMVKGFYSDIVIVFQNNAITLSQNNLMINQIDDLANLNITAFQRASTILGEEFGEMAANNPKYKEVAAQIKQINLLFLGRTDAVVMDRRIFNYYRKQAYDVFFGPRSFKDKLLQEVTFHPIFPPSEYRFAFRSEAIRDDFNHGLKIIRDDGRLAAITEKYSGLMEFPSSHSPLPKTLQ